MTTMSNLASYAPSAYELLHRIGLERRRTRAARAATCAGWLGLGVAVGGGLAYLMNSRTGPEVRERLAEKVRRARDYVAPGEDDLNAGSPSASSPSASSPPVGARGARRV